MIRLMSYHKGFDRKSSIEVARWTCLPSVRELRKYVKHPDDYGFDWMLRCVSNGFLFYKTWYYLERVL